MEDGWAEGCKQSWSELLGAAALCGDRAVSMQILLCWSVCRGVKSEGGKDLLRMFLLSGWEATYISAFPYPVPWAVSDMQKRVFIGVYFSLPLIEFLASVFTAEDA